MHFPAHIQKTITQKRNARLLISKKFRSLERLITLINKSKPEVAKVCQEHAKLMKVVQRETEVELKKEEVLRQQRIKEAQEEQKRQLKEEER